MTVSQIELTYADAPTSESLLSRLPGVVLAAVVLAFAVAGWIALFMLVPVGFTPLRIG